MGMTTKQTIALSAKKSHIVINNIIFEDGFETDRKTAIVAIDVTENDPEDMLLKAKELDWELSEEADRNGFYRAKPAKIAVEVED